MATQAGTAYVQILPDMAGFNEKLRAQLANSSKQKVKIEVEADPRQVAGVNAQIDKVKQQLDSLSKKKATPEITIETGKAAAELHRLEAELDKLRFKEVKIPVKADTSSLRQAEQHIKSFADRADKGGFSIERLGAGLTKLYKQAALITAVGIGSQAISALGAAAVATTASLAPLGGGLAAYPAIASAGAQAMGTWKLAFAGVSTAVGGLNQQINKNSQAWKDLTPEGKKFAEQLQAMKKPLQDLSAVSQQNLMPGLVEGMKSAMANFPILKQGIADTAKTLGGLAAEAGKLVGSKGFGKDLQSQMAANDVTIRRLGEGGLHLADALLQIVIAAQPLVDWMTKVALAVSQNIDQWAIAGRKSGEFADFFKKTRDVMTDVGKIALNLGGGLVNIFKDAYPVGKSLLDILTGLSGKFKDWTGSITGQNAIKQFFDNAKPAIIEAGKLVGALLVDFGKLGQGTQVAPILYTIRTQLLPAFYGLVQQTTKAFGPAFITALTNVLLIFTKLGGSSGALVTSVNLFGKIAGAINWLLDNIPFLGKAVVALGVAGGISKALGLTSALGTVTRLYGNLKLINTLGGNSFLGKLLGWKGAKVDVQGMAKYTTIQAATLEVGDIIAKNIIGGGAGGLGGAGGTGTGGAKGKGPSSGSLGGTLERDVAKETEGGFKAGAAKWLGRGIAGAGIGVVGTMLSQAVGSGIGGGVGHAVSKIGTDISIGAGLGSIFGPGGTLAGAVVGGLVGAVNTFIKDDAKGQGDRWADQFVKDIPGKVSKAVADGAKKAAEHPPPTPPKYTPPPGPPVIPQTRPPVGTPATNPAYTAQLQAFNRERADYKKRWDAWWNGMFKDAFTKGYTAGNEVVSGMKSQSHHNIFFMTTEAFRKLSTPPPNLTTEGKRIWRNTGAQQIIEYTAGLEKNHQLPAGSTDRMIATLKSKFPGLQAFLRQQGEDTGKNVAARMDFKASSKKLTDFVGKFRDTYGDINISTKLTNDNIVKNANTMWADLTYARNHSQGKERQDYQNQLSTLAGNLKDYYKKQDATTNTGYDQIGDTTTKKGKHIRDLWNNVLSDMQVATALHTSVTKNDFLTNFEQLRQQGGKKFSGIKSDAITAFTDLQAGVVPTGNATQLAMYQAFQAMGVNANELATALGIKPIQLKLTPHDIAIRKYDNAKTQQLIRSGRAGGGLIQIGQPGAAGQDTIPMNVGGQPIVVGDGEQVAVLNRHQQGFLNRVLSPIGGMTGMFNKINRPHYAAKGGIVPKFAGGGVVSYGQLEGLWNQAGGDPKMAALMAAIAEAESGGNPTAHNSSGASGLWQILGQIVPGNIYDPLINARNAVAKLVSQGLNAWVVYQTGAYRSFLHGNVPPGAYTGAGAGIIPEIPRAVITGPKGIAHDYAQEGADKARTEINKYLKDNAPVATAGVPGPTSGPAGTSVFKGILMADWVKMALQYAQTKGVQSQPTSGYRPGYDSHTATGTSEHQGIQYPHGAVDFGDYNSGLAPKMAVVNATRDYKYPLLAPIGFHDDGHASGTGHARGGFISASTGLQDVGKALLKATKIAAKPKIKFKRQPKPKKIPVLKDLHPAIAFGNMPLNGGLAQVSIDEMNAQPDTVQPNLDSWSQYISGLRGLTDSVTPIFTDDTGKDVINVGKPPNLNPGDYSDLSGYAIPLDMSQLTGLIDPSTNRPTKSIKDRLREIGNQNQRATFSENVDTDLGIQESYLDSYNLQLKDAVNLAGIFGPASTPYTWLNILANAITRDQKRAGWLSTAIDSVTQVGKLPKLDFSDLGGYLESVKRFVGRTWAGRSVWKMMQIPKSFNDLIHNKVRELKNKTAIANYLAARQKALPKEQKDQAKASKDRFDAAHKDIGKAGKSATFTAKDLLAQQLDGLEVDRHKALNAIHKPKDWIGENDVWDQVHRAERQEINMEFDDRLDAMSALLKDKDWKGNLDKSKAGSFLNKAHGVEGTAMGKGFGQYTKDLNTRWNNAAQVATPDRSWLTNLRDQINVQWGSQDEEGSESQVMKEATGSGGMGEILSTALKTLPLTVKSKRNIDIQLLLNEIRDLTGTIIPPSSINTTDLTNLKELTIQMDRLKNESDMIQVLQQQVLNQAGIPLTGRISSTQLFGGSFAEGGIVPGPPGTPIMIEAHGGEVVTPQNQIGGDTHVHISGNDAWLRNLISVEIQKETRGQSRNAAKVSRLASTGRF